MASDGSAKEIVMKIVAPSLGFVLANVMFFSGVPAMLRCKRNGSLGDMNPMPFPVVMANCLAWCVTLTHVVPQEAAARPRTLSEPRDV